MSIEAQIERDHAHFAMFICVSVPRLIGDLQRHGGPSDYQIERARMRLGSDPGPDGAAPGEAAGTAIHWAEIIAILAFAPGGIEIFGQRFLGREI